MEDRVITAEVTQRNRDFPDQYHLLDYMRWQTTWRLGKPFEHLHIVFDIPKSLSELQRGLDCSEEPLTSTGQRDRDSEMSLTSTLTTTEAERLMQSVREPEAESAAGNARKAVGYISSVINDALFIRDVFESPPEFLQAQNVWTKTFGPLISSEGSPFGPYTWQQLDVLLRRLESCALKGVETQDPLHLRSVKTYFKHCDVAFRYGPYGKSKMGLELRDVEWPIVDRVRTLLMKYSKQELNLDLGVGINLASYAAFERNGRRIRPEIRHKMERFLGHRLHRDRSSAIDSRSTRKNNVAFLPFYDWPWLFYPNQEQHDLETPEIELLITFPEVFKGKALQRRQAVEEVSRWDSKTKHEKLGEYYKIWGAALRSAVNPPRLRNEERKVSEQYEKLLTAREK